MNKPQAYEAMCQGHKVCNEYYSPEEYAFINDDGLIEYEDGCVVGNQFSENWVKYQDPECKLEWSIWIDPKIDTTMAEHLNPTIDPYVEKLSDNKEVLFTLHNYHMNYDSSKFYPKKEFIPRNHKRTNKRK